MADEYIYKQDAVNVVANTAKIVASFNYQYAIDALLALAPADVAKIVRCKNCQYHSYDEEFCCYWCEHAFMAGEVKPDFYCGYGEE